jgi:hypothetical protein
LEALGEGALHATGVSVDTGRRIPISDFEWRDLECREEQGRDIICVRQASTPRRRTVGQILGGSEGSVNGYIDVVVRRTKVIENWPPSAATELTAPRETNRRGAPPKYDWPEIETVVFTLMDEKGEFNERDVDSDWRTKADLERKILDIFEDRLTSQRQKRAQKQPTGPSESLVRKRVGAMLAKWRERAKANKGQ